MKNFLKNLKLNEARVGRLIGLGTLVLVVALIANYVASVNRVSRDILDGASTTNEDYLSQLPTTYKVAAGDSLWKIAEKVYGSGYNWVDIWSANKEILPNPGMLNIGTEITLPMAQQKNITYRVAKGDNLWNLAVHYCDDGFLWMNIAKANNLSNPRVIEVGQVLKIRCN